MKFEKDFWSVIVSRELEDNSKSFDESRYLSIQYFVSYTNVNYIPLIIQISS